MSWGVDIVTVSGCISEILVQIQGRMKRGRVRGTDRCASFFGDNIWRKVWETVSLSSMLEWNDSPVAIHSAACAEHCTLKMTIFITYLLFWTTVVVLNDLSNQLNNQLFWIVIFNNHLFQTTNTIELSVTLNNLLFQDSFWGNYIWLIRFLSK